MIIHGKKLGSKTSVHILNGPGNHPVEAYPFDLQGSVCRLRDAVGQDDFRDRTFGQFPLRPVGQQPMGGGDNNRLPGAALQKGIH